MANHGKADPADELLVLSACDEIRRAIEYQEARVSALKDRRAVLFLAAAEKRVTIPALAAAAGVSEALVRLEQGRARKMPKVPLDT